MTSSPPTTLRSSNLHQKGYCWALISTRPSTRAASHLPPVPGLANFTDDHGAEFASHSDSLAYRTIGILRTVMCSPVHASQIAHALKLPQVSVVRRLDELIKHGYNAYRVTDKVVSLARLWRDQGGVQQAR